jgi:DsbC/DsbD-like thiol-disulfide interchange protein
LSDKGSVVIRKFGILNTNVPNDVMFYGIPFPGDYLINPDGVVREKLFLPDYQERAAASQVVLKDFGSAIDDNGVTVTADDVEAKISLSGSRNFSGNEIGVMVDFTVGPGWHIYGRPLPEGYTPTAVKFDDALVSEQSIVFPKPTPVKFELLGETLPVYQGNFKAIGTLRLKQKLPPGDHTLGGTLEFQECNDSLCKMPRTAHFEIPIKIEALTPGTPKS